MMSRYALLAQIQLLLGIFTLIYFFNLTWKLWVHETLTAHKKAEQEFGCRIPGRLWGGGKQKE